MDIEEIHVKQESIIIKEEYIPVSEQGKSVPSTVTTPKAECKQYAVIKSDSKKHSTSHSRKKSYECKHCGYRTACIKYFEQHKSKCDEQDYFCARCSYSTKRKRLLFAHVRTHLQLKSFACELCDYKTALKFSLKRHLSVHTGEKPYCCNQCNYKTINKYKLEQHLLVHTGEKPHHCQQCDYKTATKYHLKQHILVHTGDVPFRCHFCEHTFKYNHIFQRHLRKHSGQEKFFRCAHCPFQTAVKYNLQNHLMTHRDERPFGCTLCPYRAKLKNTLRNHKKAVHSEVLNCTGVSLEPKKVLEEPYAIKEEPPDSVYECIDVKPITM